MRNIYWDNELKNIFSFYNFLKEINSSKVYDRVKYHFSNNMADLQEFLTRNDISFFEYYTSIISLYLSRISGSEGIIFSYNNLTPNDTFFKIKYDGDYSFLEFIISVKNIMNNALDNSIENLKEYVYESYPDYCDYIFNYSIVNAINDSNININDSNINFIIFNDFIEVEYDINTFTRIEIDHMLENIDSLIYACLMDVNQACRDVDIVCDRQLELINEFSKSTDIEIDDKLLPDIILDSVKKYPNHFAINDEINRISYEELGELINSTTYILQKEYNVTKSDKIILYLSRSYNVPLLTICLMKLGAITIPVDDTFPESYIQAIINISSPKYIIQESDYVFNNVESIQLNSLKTKRTGNLTEIDVDLDDTAIIMYTSGSTGIPKGVEITQRNIININHNYLNYFNIPEGGDGNFMCLAKFTFVASLPIYAALINGFETFIIRETTKESIPRIVKYLMMYHCYVLISTQDLGLYLYNNFDLNLDNLVLAGSSLTKSEIRKNNHTVLLNAYGCTETSGSVIINKLNDDYSNYSVIGKPLGNSKVYILDSNRKHLPVGAVGEIVISGPVVSKQYFNNVEQTNNAYGVFNNENAYFTKDLGYFNSDGTIVYVGRKDDQINLNGFRIEPEEIESTILEYGGLNSVKVIVGEVNHQDHLIAYYSSEEEIDESCLNDYLKINLPHYMIPSFYVKVNSFPLNPNGKVDVKRLPSVDFGEVKFVEPRNELEKLVVNSFENAFKQKNISIHDNFIQLGGTSVIAMQIVAELADYNLTVNDLIMLKTPEKIAEHINNSEVMDFDWDKYSLDTGCPLNESQLNVYLDIQRYEKNESYNLPLVISIPQEYGDNEVADALNEMFNVHPVLKSHIEIIDHVPYLKLGKNPEIEFLDEYDDNLILNFMNDSFDLKSNLSRYLVLKNEDGLKLVAVFHHLIFDGFSHLVFKRHLLDLLEGKSLDEDIEFLKSSVYDETISESGKYGEAEIFYESVMSEVDEVNSLLSSVLDNQAGSYSTVLPISKKDLMEFLKLNNVSENILFTSVFAYSLSRFVGSDKVLFNMADNARDEINNFDSIGMFVNTLPVLVDCKNQEISSFMEYMSDLIYNVRKYNFYPFRLLATKYGIDSNIIFQYWPDLNYSDEEGFEYTDFINLDNIVEDFEMIVVQKDDEYTLILRHSDKYSDNFAKNFVESYKLILQGILNVSRLEDINYISESDVELLKSYNQTSHDFMYSDVLDAFNDNLSDNPDDCLVSFNDKSYSYGESAFIADKLVNLLKDMDINAQDCVAFLVERSEYYMFSILGIMSMGAVYVPLDDAHPDDRIKFILEDTKSKVLVVCDETYSRAVNLINDDVVLLNISDILKGDIGTLNNLPVVYNNLACILYTSGSTGVPKGVKITRKAILNVSVSFIDNYNLSKNDIVGLFSTIGFDASTIAINSVLYVGASLNVISDELKLNVIKMNDYFIKHNVSHASLSTQVGKLFMDNIDYTSLDVLIVAGEKLGEVKSPKNYLLFDAYGPTEALIVSSVNNNDKIDSSDIGKLYYNTRIYILDDNLNPVPIGAVGELCVAGYQIADGYLNRSEETKLAFVENPFDDDEDYNIIYRTGDMVRFLPNASLGIVGRRDSQVKIRGNRVELLEVESVIRFIDIVDDVTVQTVNDKGNNELVAYVVLSHDWDGVNLVDYIRNYVNERKPDYMVPSYVVVLDSIPLTVNGKVDRRALPEVDWDSLRAEYVAPTNEIEKTIVYAFEKVFKHDKIGIHDDFVRLGGDSLSAIQLLSYLDDYNVSVADVLSLRTPKAIAESVSTVDFDLDIYSLDGGCPLNESQLNVYLDIVANDKVDAYLIPLVMDISKDYGVDDLLGALEEMFIVHPILGMCVSDEYDVPYLVKGNKPSILVESDMGDDFITEFMSKPFDLYGSLSRFLIVDCGENFRLYAVFHHIIFDALSDIVFKQDLMSILDDESLSVDDSFLKVSAFNQMIQGSDEYVDAGDFFDSLLVDSDEAGVLLDSVLSDGPGLLDFNLNLDLDLFKSFINRSNISENVLFTGVFAYTLSRFVGSNKVLFNIVENGRDRFNNFNSIGMYVNTLPLLVDCKNQDILSFMDCMSNNVYGVMKYNYYPFRVLANEYDIDSSILFQFFPDWIEDNSSDFDKGAEFDIVNDMDDLIADFSMDVSQKGSEYTLSIMYSDKYSKDMVERFAQTYDLILSQIISVNELSEINCITDEDIELLNAYNETEHDLAYDDVLDAFNDNLSKYMNNKLVSYNDVSYTYGESAFIANEISNLLSNLGVVKQDFVALFVNRSEWFLLASMGVLTRGAIYVPIDTTYPDERIILMLEDSKSNVVIVDDNSEQQMLNIISQNNLDIDILNVSDILENEVSSLNQLDNVEVSSNDVACVLYTSGTTGIPKGVLITRKALNNFVSWYVDETNFTSDDVYGMHCSYVFDIHTAALFAPIISGGSLCIVPEDVRLNLKALNDFYVENSCTHTYITSQVGKLFAESGMETSIKLLCFGGMKLGELNAPDSIGPFESYGPSENLAISTSIFANERMHHSSIGRFISNVKGYVLDNEHRRVPLGAVGELYLSGHQLSPGYLNRGEENDNAFFDNPFDDEKDYEHIYKTGDMVRFLPDGTLGIIGRQDSQVKVRGNRVELSEIEFNIRELDCVEDVTVQTVKNNDNNELVAYVVLSNDLDDNDLTDYVRSYVNDHKPDYMVPTYVIQLDSIPLTVNGKVDKRNLPEVDLDSLTAEYVAPTNEIEKQIVNAFEVVFNQNSIGLNDDFIRLGGDSITAIRIISLLEKEGISCSARDILNYKTPYLIAENVEKISKISYDASEGEVDLLPIQSYFFDQIKKDDFSQEFILKSKTDLDSSTLQRAFNELTDIHDILRVSYKYNDNDNVIQEILPLNTCVCKIKEYSTDDLNKTINNVIKESKESLNIVNDLIRISLVHYNDEDYIIFVIHHLIIDGVSWSILIDDLTYILNQIKEDMDVNLLRPYPYKNWVEDVKSLVDVVSDDEMQHWIELNNLLDDTAIKGKSKGFIFDVDVGFDVDNLLMLSEEEYWALAISRAYKKTYNENIIFNREFYGRDESLADVHRTIGWFTSQYPVLVNVDNKYDDISLMSDVYCVKRALGDVNHLGLNYGSLIYTTHELEYKQCPVTFNFLSTEFTFENELFESINMQLPVGEAVEFDLNRDSFGISLNVSRVDDSYFVSGDYAEDTYLGEKFSDFVENIKYELKFIGNYESEVVVCCLSESQLGVYLDEKVNDMGTAYSASGIFECGLDKSVDEIKNAIGVLIDKHPVLRGRVVDGDTPLLVCDSYPSIEVIESNDNYNLIKLFDLSESLARFYIVDNDGSRFVFYDIHHIISDATSRTIINKELALALDGNLDSSVDLGFVYASRDSFESKFENSYDEAHEFYKNTLSLIDDVDILLEDVDGINNSIKLPIHGVREQVEFFVRDYGITVGNFLNAVFAYSYSRFTGGDKVYYNFTEHGRHETYLEDALGMYIRTIPIIVNCENKSIKEYLSDVSDLILDSMRYSVYPFRLLAREFDLHNSVTFEYNFDLNDVSGIGDELIIEDMSIGLFSDFLCVVNDLSDGFVISVESCDKYSNDTIIRFLNVFKEILYGMLNKDNLSDINYISASDLKLLDNFNQREHDLDYCDILESFNDNLSKYPDKKLVVGDLVEYSYCESAYLINEVKLLLNNIVSSNVILFVERNHWVLLAALGILASGNAYVPIDENYPNKHIQFIIEETNAKTIITTDTFQERVNKILKDIHDDFEVINISCLEENVESLLELDYVVPNYDDVACIHFTSGTTGTSKGVLATRLGVYNMVEFYVDVSGFTWRDIHGVFSSLGFDVTLAMYSSIVTGGSVTIVPNDIRLDIYKLNEYYTKHGVSHSIISTHVAKLFCKNIKETSIKHLQAIGEKLGKIIHPEEYVLSDVYGPTETVLSITSIDVTDKTDDSSVGLLNHNTKGYILDNNQNMVPYGAVGELYISGYQVSKGYLNNQEATDKAFFENPFDGDKKYYEKMYKTGDVVRLLPDGTLGFIGRNDSQVKIRGNRVELTEIEYTIRNINYIDDVTVQTINNDLVAYVVTNQEINNLENKIKEHISSLKPNYMVPSFIIELNEIPFNQNGKVDKRALPLPDIAPIDYIAPSNKIETDIVAAFGKVFKKDRINVNDDFIQLGGSSLVAMELLTYLKNYNLSASDILRFTTPKDLARKILDNYFSNLNLDKYSLESGCPLNTTQYNIYLDIINNSKDIEYNSKLITKMPSELTLDESFEIIVKLLNANPILKTYIDDENDIPYLKIGDDYNIEISENNNAEHILDFINSSFDLNKSLSRFLLLEKDGDIVLISLIHHIIFDGHSRSVFIHELLELSKGNTLEIDNSFLKLVAYEEWLDENNKYEEAREFYSNMLQNSNEVSHALFDEEEYKSGWFSFKLDIDESIFNEFLMNNFISENIFFASVFAYALSIFSGDDEVVFTIIENGRGTLGNVNSIGMYSNSLLVHIDCNDADISTFVGRNRDIIHKILYYNYYPPWKLNDLCDMNAVIVFQYNEIDNIYSDYDLSINIDNYDESLIDMLFDETEFKSIADINVNVNKHSEYYEFTLMHSERYSYKTVKHFARLYSLILKQILRVNRLSDIEFD